MEGIFQGWYIPRGGGVFRRRSFLRTLSNEAPHVPVLESDIQTPIHPFPPPPPQKKWPRPIEMRDLQKRVFYSDNLKKT